MAERAQASAIALVGTPASGHETFQTYLTMAVDDITIDHDVHPRREIRSVDVRAFRRILHQGHSLDPPVVFFDGNQDILADGFSRVEAHRAEGHLKIEVQRVLGSRRDAAIYAISANAKHGRKLTNAEKRAAVVTLLFDADWVSRSDREVAGACGCTHPTVRKIRESLTVSGKISTDITRTIRTKHGKRVTQNRVDRLKRKWGAKPSDRRISKPTHNVSPANDIRVTGDNAAWHPCHGAELAIERLEAIQKGIDSPGAIIIELIASDDRALFQRFEGIMDWLVEFADGYGKLRQHFRGPG